MQLPLCSTSSRVIQPAATVIGTSNSGGLIEIQTSGPHGLLTNDLVQCVGIGGTIAANGQFMVTKIDSTHVTLNNSGYLGAYSAGGQILHLGWSPGSLVLDNTVFTSVPDYSICTRLEALSVFSNIRLCYQDAVDVNFLTAEPLAIIQSGANGGTLSQESIVTVVKRDQVPDARFGVSGAHLRLLVYVSGGAFSSAQVSSWLGW